MIFSADMERKDTLRRLEPHWNHGMIAASIAISLLGAFTSTQLFVLHVAMQFLRREAYSDGVSIACAKPDCLSAFQAYSPGHFSQASPSGSVLSGASISLLCWRASSTCLLG